MKNGFSEIRGNSSLIVRQVGRVQFHNGPKCQKRHVTSEELWPRKTTCLGFGSPDMLASVSGAKTTVQGDF